MLYVALILPYKLVFVKEIYIEWDHFEEAINACFIVDIFICMFSAYYDEEGVLVNDTKTIVVIYLKSWFTIDLIACVPWDLLFSATNDGIYF